MIPRTVYFSQNDLRLRTLYFPQGPYTLVKIFSMKLKGMNRQRQKAHGSEIPEKRNPDLIITGAKKCGTTALKIFMNYHNSFQDTPGERHFFNRPSNWQKGYEW